MNRFLVLLIYILTVGCAVESPRELDLNEPLGIDNNEFSTEEQEQLAYAMISWSRATNGCVELGWTDQGTAQVNYDLPLTDSAMARTFRTKDSVRITIKRQPWALPENLQIVFAHELGHALGLDHQKSGLMCYGTDCTNTQFSFSDDGVLLIDEETIAAFNSIRGQECQ